MIAVIRLKFICNKICKEYNSVTLFRIVCCGKWRYISLYYGCSSLRKLLYQLSYPECRVLVYYLW